MFTEGDGARGEEPFGHRRAEKRRHAALFVDRDAAHRFEHHGLDAKRVERSLQFLFVHSAPERILAVLGLLTRRRVVRLNVGFETLRVAADELRQVFDRVALRRNPLFDHRLDHGVEFLRDDFPAGLLLQHVDVGLRVDHVFVREAASLFIHDDAAHEKRSGTEEDVLRHFERRADHGDVEVERARAEFGRDAKAVALAADVHDAARLRPRRREDFDHLLVAPEPARGDHNRLRAHDRILAARRDLRADHLLSFFIEHDVDEARLGAHRNVRILLDGFGELSHKRAARPLRLHDAKLFAAVRAVFFVGEFNADREEVVHEGARLPGDHLGLLGIAGTLAVGDDVLGVGLFGVLDAAGRVPLGFAGADPPGRNGRRPAQHREGLHEKHLLAGLRGRAGRHAACGAAARNDDVEGLGTGRKVFLGFFRRADGGSEHGGAAERERGDHRATGQFGHDVLPWEMYLVRRNILPKRNARRQTGNPRGRRAYSHCGAPLLRPFIKNAGLSSPAQPAPPPLPRDCGRRACTRTSWLFRTPRGFLRADRN